MKESFDGRRDVDDEKSVKRKITHNLLERSTKLVASLSTSEETLKASNILRSTIEKCSKC